MLSIVITLAAVAAAPFIFIRLEKWWKRFLTRNMIGQYDTLSLQILYGCFTWAEATQEIADFKYTWINHPECEKYVGLLKRALEKYNEQYLGI